MTQNRGDRTAKTRNSAVSPYPWELGRAQKFWQGLRSPQFSRGRKSKNRRETLATQATSLTLSPLDLCSSKTTHLQRQRRVGVQKSPARQTRLQGSGLAQEMHIRLPFREDDSADRREGAGGLQHHFWRAAQASLVLRLDELLEDLPQLFTVALDHRKAETRIALGRKVFDAREHSGRVAGRGRSESRVRRLRRQHHTRSVKKKEPAQKGFSPYPHTTEDKRRWGEVNIQPDR